MTIKGSRRLIHYAIRLSCFGLNALAPDMAICLTATVAALAQIGLPALNRGHGRVCPVSGFGLKVSFRMLRKWLRTGETEMRGRRGDPWSGPIGSGMVLPRDRYFVMSFF